MAPPSGKNNSNPLQNTSKKPLCSLYLFRCQRCILQKMKKRDPAELEAVHGVVAFLWQPEKELLYRDRFYYKINPFTDRSGRLEETNRQLEALGWEARFAGREAAPILEVKPKAKAGFPWLASGLFAATVLSVIFFPPFLQYETEIFRNWKLVSENLPFAFGLLAILTC